MYAPVYETADLKDPISAFTIAELGEMLPPQYESPVRGKTGKYGGGLLGTWETTEADARAKMLVCFWEHRLLH